MDSVKYDRQIRLFGSETQNKLVKTKVQVIGIANAASAEIVKNLVLLGVGSITVTQEIVEETRKLVPDTLESINQHIQIRLSTAHEACDYCFCVGTEPIDPHTQNSNVDRDRPDERASTRYFYVCRNGLCYSNSQLKCQCDFINDIEPCLFAKNCITGAFAVQEFLKVIQGKPCVQFYRL